MFGSRFDILIKKMLNPLVVNFTAEKYIQEKYKYVFSQLNTTTIWIPQRKSVRSHSDKIAALLT